MLMVILKDAVCDAFDWCCVIFESLSIIASNPFCNNEGTGLLTEAL